VQDIATPGTHELLEFPLALLMGQGQVDNKPLSKMIDLPQRDIDVSVTEFLLNLFAIATAYKQGLSDMDDDIKTKLSVGRYNRLEFVAVVGLFTLATSQLSDMGMKLADSQ
jgi:hypothetical protein